MWRERLKERANKQTERKREEEEENERHSVNTTSIPKNDSNATI